MNATVSVVIPARNSQSTIRYTIESLLNQTLPPNEIVVAAGEGDLTSTAIKDYIDRGFVKLIALQPPLHLIRDAQWKRREGARNTVGDVIFFTDSKCFLNSAALEKTLKLMERYNVKALAGIVPAWPEQANSLMSMIQDKGLIQNNPNFPAAGFITKENFGKTESLPCMGAFAMTRDAFEAIKDDFAVEFSATSPSYEDYITAWLLARRGISILTTNSVICYHKHRLVLSEYLTQISRSGLGAAAMKRQYPDCPYGLRRLIQVFTVIGVTAVSLIIATITIILFGFLAVKGIVILLALCFFAIGIVNAIKAKHAFGLIIPLFTALLIFTFSFSFMKGYVKRGYLKPQEAIRYLQS